MTGPDDFRYTLEDYLAGKLDFDFPREALATILFDRGIMGMPLAADVPAKTRELCFADLLMWAADSAVVSTSELNSDGGWQHQSGVKNPCDRDAMRAKARAIYSKYGDPLAETPGGAAITMKPLY